MMLHSMMNRRRTKQEQEIESDPNSRRSFFIPYPSVTTSINCRLLLLIDNQKYRVSEQLLLKYNCILAKSKVLEEDTILPLSLDYLL
jgi:hypothetical protein